jgi:hypothetical protein
MAHQTPTDAKIASGASLSGIIRCNDGLPAAIAMPSTWTTASLTFQGSADGVTFLDLYDSAGNEITVTAAASRLIVFHPADLCGLVALKVRSGTSGTPVNQAADRTLSVVLHKS